MSVRQSARGLIWVQPDAQYFRKAQGLVFQLPGELHRAIVDPITPELGREAFARAYKEFAMPCIRAAMNRPELTPFEVLNEAPFGMRLPTSSTSVTKRATTSTTCSQERAK